MVFEIKKYEGLGRLGTAFLGSSYETPTFLNIKRKKEATIEPIENIYKSSFISPSLERTLPLSPSSCLFFSRGFISDCVYLDIDDAMLEQTNLLRKLFCRESIILNQEVNDPSCFDTKST